MQTRLLLILMIAITGVLVSCGDDDSPTVNPLVGEWELDEIIVAEAPSSFSNVEGREFSTFYGEDEYIFRFNTDLTYEREIENSVYGDLEDEGTWEQTGDELILAFDDGDEGLATDFNVVGDIDDKLTLSLDNSILALSDEIINSAEFQAMLDTVTTDELNSYLDTTEVEIQVTLELEFDKQ